MGTMTQKAVLTSLALLLIILALPRMLGAQVVSARPASVVLTVVVPPRRTDGIVASEGIVSLVGTTATAIDFDTMVGLADRAPARIEIRLGAAWTGESTHVLVRNRRGEFERLLRDASVIALDTPRETRALASPLHFRVESSAPLALSSLAIPVEYRVTIGRGDEFSVWSFPALLRLDHAH
jgi:hypothetical protein